MDKLLLLSVVTLFAAGAAVLALIWPPYSLFLAC